MLQNGLNSLQRLRSCNAFLDDLWFELLDGFAILDNLLDETRPHHLTIIGNGIIERHRIDGCNLGLIAYRHPRQRSGIPVVIITSVLLTLRHTDKGRTITGKDILQLQVLTDTYPVKAFDIALGLVMVEFVYHMTHTDIRTDLQRSGHVDITIAATTPVVVFHLTAIHRHDTTTGMDDVTSISGILSQHLIIQRNEYRSSLKHRTWFTTVTHGRVDGFDVVAVFVPHQIDDSLHVTGLYFHEDSHT